MVQLLIRVKGVYSATKGEQSGAVEACWAHNPEVDGSKPSAASSFFSFLRHHCFQDTNRENYTITGHPLIAQLVERRTVEA